MPDEQPQAERYRARRKRLAEQLGGGVALIHSSGAAPDPALEDMNLFYLTGLKDRSAYLLLAPQGLMVERVETHGGPELMRGRRVHEILFLEAPNPQAAFMEGVSVVPEAIRAATGVDRVYPLSQMNQHLERALMTTDTLWLNTPRTPRLDDLLASDLSHIKAIRERFYWIQLKNLAPLIHQMRFVKDDYEIAALRGAFVIQTAIFEKMMRSLKPGTNERMGQAIFDNEIQIRPDHVTHGTETVIVAAGKHAAIPHYHDNNQDIKDGELVLIDAGVAVNGYSADITRTFPANGRFNRRHRELYSIVLEAEQAAIATLKPGSTMLKAHQAVYEVFAKHNLVRYSYGNCGHPVGLNIHDANGRYPDDREQRFEPGVVVVIVPFLMMPDEGIGIRIEDGVLITDTGAELLSGPAREIDAVEALCLGR